MRWFPEREIYLRAQGEVRFIRLSSRVQATVAGSLAALAGIWLVLTGATLISGWQTDRQQDDLDRHAATVQAQDRHLRASRQQLDERARELEERQQQLEGMVRKYLGKPAADAGSPPAGGKLSPERRLSSIDERQRVFAAELTRLALAKGALQAKALNRLGLRPPVAAPAMGGPFIALADAPADDDRWLHGLRGALAHWSSVRSMATVLPSGMPAHRLDMSSGYGTRRDPFNHRLAFHAGTDFRGSIGDEIVAAGAGRVTKAGRFAGYGNAVVLDHGFGLTSVYGHLSRIKVQVGQRVGRGDLVGLMGSTGRSTGSHLHFEVRLNGRAINPRPLLEAGHDT
jgi:murein DD-endopeptidase MepM/ murein hydrolase activator NlpD